jgi:hypothetical protein
MGKEREGREKYITQNMAEQPACSSPIYAFFTQVSGVCNETRE